MTVKLTANGEVITTLKAFLTLATIPNPMSPKQVQFMYVPVEACEGCGILRRKTQPQMPSVEVQRK